MAVPALCRDIKMPLVNNVRIKSVIFGSLSPLHIIKVQLSGVWGAWDTKSMHGFAVALEHLGRIRHLDIVEFS
jgi:hypothetical protein